MRKFNIRYILLGLYISITVWLYPVLFLYAQNVKETSLKDCLYSLSLMVICSLLSLGIGKICFIKTDFKIAVVFSAFLGIIGGNYKLVLDGIQKVIPQVRYWHLALIAIFLIILICKLVLYKNCQGTVCFIIGIVFSVLVFFNILITIPTNIKKISTQSIELEQVKTDISSSKSNIYYLLCDEYASFAQLEKDFGYDNNYLKSELEQMKFYISQTSRNDTSATTIVMSNIMSMDYVATYDTITEERDVMMNTGKLHSVLRANGYKEIGIGDTEWLGIPGTISNDNISKDADGKNFTEIAMEKSFLFPLYRHNYTAAAEEIRDTFVALKELDIVPNSGLFTLFYVSCPHHPYFFKADGSTNSTEAMVNDDGSHPDSYIGQVEYTNNQIIPAIKRIIEKDPDSIIILCSDHGNRFGNITADMETRILNAIYYKGEIVSDFEGLSGLNTIIYVLNRENNLNIEYVPLPRGENKK